MDWLDASAADALALMTQLLAHARAAVRVPAALVHQRDLGGELPIGLRARRLSGRVFHA